MNAFVRPIFVCTAITLATLGGQEIVKAQSSASSARSASNAAASSEEGTRVPLVFTGGHATDRRDGGRPVVLIASALAVPSEVFRATFRNVTPGSGGREPEPGQVNLNKQALLKGLGPYGVTNDRLDTVSNFYRYNGSRGEMWRHESAAGYALVRDGKVVKFTITNPGYGYNSAPKITLQGMENIRATGTLSFSTDFSKNGSIKAITLGGTEPSNDQPDEQTRPPRRNGRRPAPPPPPVHND